ncbi:MAG: VOC family protein [Armatimonadota bacterium]
MTFQETLASGIIPMLAANNASEVLHFYTNVFGAVVIDRIEAADGSLLHANVRIGEALFMLADECPPHNVSPETLEGSPVLLHLVVASVDETLKSAILSGGQLIREPADQPTGYRAAKIRDPAGHIWYLASPIRTG